VGVNDYGSDDFIIFKEGEDGARAAIGTSLARPVFLARNHSHIHEKGRMVLN